MCVALMWVYLNTFISVLKEINVIMKVAVDYRPLV